MAQNTVAENDITICISITKEKANPAVKANWVEIIRAEVETGKRATP
ncbi:hypothetical protein CCACVL1_25607 [Corchorus capsularis]|uniref:Uncharacterized protein n=1 Tax=Corchorus capsularis TaxID=210143 RepID=A0A1R3GJ02_COCAP|nr:hypothetical protein CCACVL1_25607 [Corchorus capsularis]